MRLLLLMCSIAVAEAIRSTVVDLPTRNKPLIAYTWAKQEGIVEELCHTSEGNYDPNENDRLLVPCSFLPEEFIRCDPLPAQIVAANETGCTHFGGTRWADIAWTNVSCRVLPCIECAGQRTFMRERPCIKYTGHYFLSTLLYSIFMGMLAVDRFCLGYSAIAVGKLMTLGGLGVWWIIDIFLLTTGNLMPADNSNWEPYY